MMRPVFPACLLLSAAMLLTSTLVVEETRAAEESVPTDRLLPPRVVAYVTVPSASKLKNGWQGSSYGRIFSDPKLADFRDDVLKKIKTSTEVLEKNIGLTLDELLAIPSGEVSLAIVHPPAGKVAIVAFLEFGESGQAVDSLLDKVSEKLTAAEMKRKESEFDDTSITSFVKQPDAAADPKPNGGSGRSVSWFVRDSTLVISSEVAALESVLVRWDGEHARTFAESRVYEYIVERCSDDDEALLYWYVDPIGLYKSVIALAGPAGAQLSAGLFVVPMLGLDKLKALGGSMDFGGEKYDSIARTVAYVDGPPSGLLAALQFSAEEQRPPSWVSAETTRYFTLNWDVEAAYTAIESLVDSFRQPGTLQKMLDGMVANDGRLHPKTDVIDQLSGKVHVAIDLPKPDDPSSMRALVAVGVKDEKKMQGVLATLAKDPTFPGKVREFQGSTLYELPIRGAGTAAISVVGGQIMFSNSVQRLEQVIRRDSDRRTLAESDAFQRLVREIPQKTALLAFQADDGQMRVVYEALRNGAREAPAEGIDFEKLPAFSAIEKYLKPSLSYAVPDKNGVLFVTFSLQE